MTGAHPPFSGVLRRLRRRVAALAALCALGSLTGCYTFSGATLPGYLKTVRIHPVQNRTLDPAFAEQFMREVVRGFEERSSLRAVNTGGDCDLQITLEKYSHAPYLTSGKVTDFRLDVSASVRFYDQVKKELIYEEKNLPGFASYSVDKGETEADGQAVVIEAMVALLLDKTVSGW